MKTVFYVSTVFACALSTNAFSDTTQQLCIEDGSDSACFIETISEGRSTFVTDAVSYPKLILNDRLSDLNFEFEQVPVEQYKHIFETKKPISFFFSVQNPTRIDALSFDLTANCNARDDQPAMVEGSWWNSWGRCAAGTIGGGLGVGVAGAAGLGAVGAAAGIVGGPGGVAAGAVAGVVVGGALGAVGGALSGAADSCGASIYIHTKDGFYNAGC